mmetsp:Transcript_20018/g.47055  ORF Transcript_20018/g.47055 Transcript_20018/m.47055 type:complete len:217 (+) Transcript_20018:392-1042(+)
MMACNCSWILRSDSVRGSSSAFIAALLSAPASPLSGCMETAPSSGWDASCPAPMLRGHALRSCSTQLRAVAASASLCQRHSSSCSRFASTATACCTSSAMTCRRVSGATGAAPWASLDPSSSCASIGSWFGCWGRPGPGGSARSLQRGAAPEEQPRRCCRSFARSFAASARSSHAQLRRSSSAKPSRMSSAACAGCGAISGRSLTPGPASGWQGWA